MVYPDSGVLLDQFCIGQQLRISSNEADHSEGPLEDETSKESTEQLRKAWRLKLYDPKANDCTDGWFESGWD